MINIAAKAASGKTPVRDNTEYLDRVERAGFIVFTQNRPSRRANLFDTHSLGSDHGGKACKRTSEDNLRPPWKRGKPISESEEERLGDRAMAGDKKARERLIESHWFLCAKVAAKYRRKISFEDAMSEAMAALIRAVDVFDPTKGRLKGFAWRSMRGAISSAELKNFSLGPIGGKKERHLFFNINKEKAKRGIVRMGGLTEQEAAAIAKSLSTPEIKLSARDVLTAEARFSGGGDQSLDAPLGSDEDGDDFTAADLFADDKPWADAILINGEERDALEFSLNQLDKRERRIFEARALDNPRLSLVTLGQEFDRSREWVRQIELVAASKVKAAVLEFLTRNRLARHPALAGETDGGLDPWRRYRSLIDKNFSPELARHCCFGTPRICPETQDRPRKTILQVIDADARFHRKHLHLGRIEALKVVDFLAREVA